MTVMIGQVGIDLWPSAFNNAPFALSELLAFVMHATLRAFSLMNAHSRCQLTTCDIHLPSGLTGMQSLSKATAVAGWF